MSRHKIEMLIRPAKGAPSRRDLRLGMEKAWEIHAMDLYRDAARMLKSA